MTKTNQQLSQTRRDDADAMALALGYRSKKHPERGSHRAMETDMLDGFRKGERVSVQIGDVIRVVNFESPPSPAPLAPDAGGQDVAE